MWSTIVTASTIVLFIAPAQAAPAQQLPVLGHGVNIELWSSAELGTPSERIDRASAAGFDFVRLGVPVTPWLRDDGIDRQPGVLRIVSEAVNHGLAEHLRVMVTLFVIDAPGGVKTGVVVCDAGGARGRYLQGLDAILPLLPDSDQIAFEPLNEPPGGCTGGQTGKSAGPEWPTFQQDLYRRVRKLRPHLIFVVDGGDWGQLDGLLGFDPREYVTDTRAMFSFHYYEPKLFTHQGVTFTTPEERFARLVPWPTDEQASAAARATSLRALDAAGMEVQQKQKAKNSLVEHFDLYRSEGTETYLAQRFQALAQWASQNEIDDRRVLVGEVGVARPTHNTQGQPPEGAGRYLTSVATVAESHHFSWAIWDLDGGFAFLCGAPPGDVRVCSAYRSVLQTAR
jgi:hypothetical protein